MNGLMMNTPLLITAIMQHAERSYPNREIVSVEADGSRHRYTYADAFRRARRLANALDRLSLKRGDRLATLAWNDFRHFEIYYATSCSGYVCHTINPRLFPEQIDYIVGSGQHTNSHMMEVNGYFYQLPLTWYTQDGKWDLPTGFDAHRFMRPMQIEGLGGRTLEQYWADSVRAYRSISMPDFPNFFMLMGPQSPVGNFSLIDVAEIQFRYIDQLLEPLRAGRCRAVVATAPATERFTDEVKAAISGMLGTETREQIIGLAQVKDVFRSSKLGAIAGCLVVEGVVKRSNPIRVLRDNVVIHEGKIGSLRRFKDDAKEVRSGFECGIAIERYQDVKPNDEIEAFAIELSRRESLKSKSTS